MEEKITRWHSEDYHEEKKDKPTDGARVEEKKEETKTGYQGKCSSCGVSVTTPFQPDGIRPIYCKECLAKAKRETSLAKEKKPVVIAKPKFAAKVNRPAPVKPKKVVSDEAYFVPRSKAELEVEQKFMSLEELSTAQPQSFYSNKKKTNIPEKPVELTKKEEELNEGEEINLEN